MRPGPHAGRRRLGVLISGRGSNLQALIDATQEDRLNAEIGLVISSHDGAPGLARARAAGIEAICVPPGAHRSRDAYDRALLQELQARNVELVCLAGFMRLVGRTLIDAYPNAIVNIHPSLLPSFPGLDAQRQAVEYGVKVSGVTVHLVTPELDAGPIILQRTVPVLDDDTAETLAQRILDEEHKAYPEALALLLGARWRLVGRRVVRSPSVDAT
jgi:phosphoribosylglycinamide formyltransferase-1